MKNYSEIDNKVLTKVAELLEEGKPLPAIVLGGHNVFHNFISNSVVIQLNVGNVKNSVFLD